MVCSLLISVAPLQAQAVIDLDKGKMKLRSKTLSDYNVENKHPFALREDSLQYSRNLTQAFNLLYADSLQQAEALLRECLKLQPRARGNMVVRRTLGEIYLSQERYKEAIDEFTSILKIHPENGDVRFSRASAYLSYGNARAALQDCDVLHAAATTDSTRARVLFLRAATKMQLRSFSEARADLIRVLDLEPQNENAPILLALALDREGRPKEALQRLDIFINLHPTDLQAKAMRATLLKNQERWGEALADYDDMLTAEPDNRDWRVSRAEVLIEVGNNDAARRDLDKAVSLGLPRASLQTLYQKCR